jgi:hypothetical protein
VNAVPTYYERNRERILSYQADYYRSNKEKVAQRVASWNRKRMSANKREFVDLLGGSCMCGEQRLPALQFHHRSGEDKSFEISTAVRNRNAFTIEELEIELAKCDLLCANCHAVEHCTWSDVREVERRGEWQ